MSYIVPKDKPSGCYKCPFMDKITYDCKLMYSNDYPDFESQYANCPLVEIIWCKDCKYMTEHYDTDGNVPYWTCSEWDSGTDYDGFCHYAERREVNNEI